MTSAAPPRAARGPVPPSERALAPDLARGAMLLLIALAHSAQFAFATTPGFAPEPQGLERIYNLVLFTGVHARALPLFALMFGYGMVQLARRQEAVGAPGAARAVLLRRSAALLAFGLAHGVLLFSGDILGAYGIIGVVLAFVLVGRGERVYRLGLWYLGFAAVYVLTLAGLVVAGIATSGPERAAAPASPFASVLAPDYPASLVVRLGEWPLSTLVLCGMVFAVWLGAWAARRRLLEEPGDHRRLLVTGAVAGLGIGAAGGLPMGLLSAGWLHADAATAGWIKLLYEVSGTFGGVGYLCLFGLIAHALVRTNAPSRPVVRAVAALGRRSLSGYLLQSAAWLALLSPFALDLGAAGPSTALVAVACAVGVWGVTVVGAAAMERRDFRGPAELLLRRLAYGRSVRRPRPPRADQDGKELRPR